MYSYARNLDFYKYCCKPMYHRNPFVFMHRKSVKNLELAWKKSQQVDTSRGPKRYFKEATYTSISWDAA